MSDKKLSFVSFEFKDGSFRPFVSLESFIGDNADWEVELQKASVIYEKAINTMRSIITEIENIRRSGLLTPARKVWQIGDSIFKLTEQLEDLSLQITNLYDHLVRDLNVKRKWLEKAIIFRRYLPKERFIPKDLNWGKCEKGTRKIAENLRKEYH